MCVSEIRVKRICVNQGLGVSPLNLTPYGRGHMIFELGRTYHQACLSYLVTLTQWKRKYFIGIVLLSFDSLLSSGKGHR